MSRQEADELCRKLCDTLEVLLGDLCVYTVASRPDRQLAAVLMQIATQLERGGKLHVDMMYRMKEASTVLSAGN